MEQEVGGGARGRNPSAELFDDLRDALEKVQSPLDFFVAHVVDDPLLRFRDFMNTAAAVAAFS